MKYLYHFSIDVFSQSLLTGWVRHRFLPGKAITVQFKEGETILGECCANMLREDVKAQNLHPSGLCGFSFNLPSSYKESKRKKPISISIKASGTHLTTLDPNMAGKVVRPKLTIWQQIKPPYSSQKARGNVFFMHIPKTAGTSFNSFARNLYKPTDILTHIEAYDVSTYSQIAEDYRFISGHLRMDSVLKYFTGPNTHLYTIIREPYAQLHSHLNWLRGIGVDKDGAFYGSHHALFKELANQFGEKTTLSHDDLQRIVDDLSGVLRRLLDNNQSRHFLSSDPEKIDSSHWQELKKNYALFTEVGVTKNYTLFKEEFCNLNKFSKPQAEKPLNIAKHLPLYDCTDPVSQEIVFPLVSMDLDLYNMAVTKN